ncbi:unnamed protein product [Ambrosiozyma monospora]|uniref:Unnamed protein product n=1 Tax=Ambrosiozyma monospora TaxID=43982 RepID=A0A9W6Z1F9_AMBMO|nr:unnamed protein product [Ambrosiozyma monospora]
MPEFRSERFKSKEKWIDIYEQGEGQLDKDRDREKKKNNEPPMNLWHRRDKRDKRDRRDRTDSQIDQQEEGKPEKKQLEIRNTLTVHSSRSSHQCTEKETREQRRENTTYSLNLLNSDAQIL